MASREPAQLLWTVGGETMSLTLDVTTNRQLSMSSELTTHPVEDGTSLSDHAFSNPDTISFQGIVSESPCYIPVDFNQGATGMTKERRVKGKPRVVADVVNALPGQLRLFPGAPAGIPIGGRLITGLPAGAPPVAFMYGPDVSQSQRPRLIIEALTKLRNDKTILTYKCKDYRRENMFMKQCDINHPKGGGRIEVAIQLEQIQQASVTTVEEPIIPTKAKTQGNKSAKKVEDAQPAESFSHKARDAVKGWLGL